MHMRTLVLTASLALGMAAWAATPDFLPNEPSNATVSLDLDWQTLVNWLRATPTEEESPVPWAVSLAEYQAVSQDGTDVRVEALLRIHVWPGKRWTPVPVIGTSVGVDEAHLDGAPVALAPWEGDRFAVLIEEPGDHELRLVFHPQVTTSDGVVSLQLPVAATAVTRVLLTLPFAQTVVTAPQATDMSVERGEKSLTARMLFPATSELSLGWTLPAAQVPDVPVEPAKLTATVATLAAVSDRLVSCVSSLHYDVLKGATSSFEVLLPPAVTVLRVDGAGAEWSVTRPEEGPQALQIRVNHLIEQGYDLALTYEWTPPAGAATSVVPLPQVLDVARVTGHIAVTALGNVELGDAVVEELTRIDAAEVPGQLAARAERPIQLAYRYHEPAPSLAVPVRRLEDLPVRVMAIEAAELLTVISDKGLAVTRATYYLRNNVKQFLRVTLPEGATLWGAEVAGQPVKPAKDVDSAAVMVPLVISGRSSDGTAPIAVSVVYQEQYAALDAFAALQLHAPVVETLVNEATWEVRLPERTAVVRVNGDFEAARQISRYASYTLGERKAGVSFSPAKEAIERFFIADEPQSAAEYGKARLDRGVEEDLQAMISGVLPIPIRIPDAGRPSYYRNVLIPEAGQATLSLTTMRAWWRPLIAPALALLGVALGLMLGWGLAGATSRAYVGGITLALLVAGLAAVALFVGGPWTYASVGGAVGTALGGVLRTRIGRREAA